jgi:hypothetical protein
MAHLRPHSFAQNLIPEQISSSLGTSGAVPVTHSQPRNELDPDGRRSGSVPGHGD